MEVLHTKKDPGTNTKIVRLRPSRRGVCMRVDVKQAHLCSMFTFTHEMPEKILVLSLWYSLHVHCFFCGQKMCAYTHFVV